MITNLFWAFIYNLIGIPIAAGLLYIFTGYFLPPYLAAVFMASSSVSVVINALFLKRFEPRTEQQIEEEKLLNSEKTVKDPVCGMEVLPSRALEYQYQGKSYHFCNPNCETQFKLDPEKFKNYDKMDPKLMHTAVVEEKHEEKKDIDYKEILKCAKCEHQLEMPMHCGQAMHKDGDQLVCWMGASCGAQPIPEHCGVQMQIKKVSELENIKEEKKMGNLKCSKCGNTQDIPMHCGQAMHKEGDQLVCWMGASCGAQPIPEHCDVQMEVNE